MIFTIKLGGAGRNIGGAGRKTPVIMMVAH